MSMATQHPTPELWEHLHDQDNNYTPNFTLIYKLWEEGTSPDDLDVTDQGESAEQMCGQQPGYPPVSTKNIIIEKSIGDGSFGEVYRAALRSDKGAESKVIIKRSKDHVYNTLDNERKLYILLIEDQNPTPRVFHQLLFAAMMVKPKRETMMLGMQYMTDTNLHVLIASEDEVAENGEVVRSGWKDNYNEREIHLMPVLEQLIEANHYMKRRGIHHLDIKPKNIIYCNDEHSGNYQRLWLIDFGSAVQTESDVKEYMERLPGLTRWYAPPETLLDQDFLAKGKRIYYVHHTSDIYSIAATCCHLLSGQIPWGDYKDQQCNNFKEAYTKKKPTRLQEFIKDDTRRTNSLSLHLIGMLEVDFTKRTTQEKIVDALKDYKELNSTNEQGDTNMAGDGRELQLEISESGENSG